MQMRNKALGWENASFKIEQMESMVGLHKTIHMDGHQVESDTLC
jgi:hypothetical protein